MAQTLLGGQEFQLSAFGDLVHAPLPSEALPGLQEPSWSDQR